MRPRHSSHNLKEKDDLGDINADGREIFIRINLGEVECKVVDWTQQARDTIQYGRFCEERNEIACPIHGGNSSPAKLLSIS